MNPIFISHATQDDDFVKELRIELEKLGLTVWLDSRNLRGGNKLAAEIRQVIEQARHFIVVLSPNTINSPWLRKEIQCAVKVEQQQDGYRVIPLLLPGVELSALDLWFDEPPLVMPIQLKPGDLSEALPAILAALGEKRPDDQQQLTSVESKPVAELLLKLTNLQFDGTQAKRRAKATAMLIYSPPNSADPEVESQDFIFTAPLGPIETGDLQWYLEKYYIWAAGPFKERAANVEAKLPQWGQALYNAVFSNQAKNALTAWQHLTASDAARRFSVLVDPVLPESTDENEQTIAQEAGSDLLSLPWELLHDEQDYLFQQSQAVRVRRRLPNRRELPVRSTELPIRILLLSPRPEDENADYINHRAGALPLVEAVESLGDLVELTVLTPPTFPALQQALQRATDNGKPFDVIHVDGHGVYDNEHGLGALCFEEPKDVHKLALRATAFVNAKEIAEVMRDHRIPLVFLEACKTAKSEKHPTASVAAQLLEAGVTSVVAMSHSVLLETARRFVKAFYKKLASGARVGKAMLAGQRTLKGDSYRGKKMGAGDFHLQDWFVPVLYQGCLDPQLFTAKPPKAVRQLQAQQRCLSLGALPEPPAHTFIGRSRELLALERLLYEHPYAVVRGQSGAGKTTLAVELARWLVQTGRFQRAAFVSLEEHTDTRSVLDSLGQQLLPEGEKWSVAQYADEKQALQPVERALSDHKTLIVLDNLESVLPDASGKTPTGADSMEKLWGLCQALLHADGATRLVFTSRESLYERVTNPPFEEGGNTFSFEKGGNISSIGKEESSTPLVVPLLGTGLLRGISKHFEIPIGPLSPEEAITLVSQVITKARVTLTDPGTTPKEITDLVEAVNCHARALVLLVPEVIRLGVCATTETLHQLMDELDQKYPEDRENSLYASVELSLRRLSPETRDKIPALAVFHGGAQLGVWAGLLKLELETVKKFATALIEVGLAEFMGYGHLRLDPALPAYLRREMNAAELEALKANWGAAMAQLVSLLYQQQFQNAQFSAQLTLLELPNLLVLLEWVQRKLTPEQVAGLAGGIERLLANLNRPQALAQVIAVREKAKQALKGWGGTQFEAERLKIERLLDRHDLQSAYTAAQKLLQRCLAGETDYPDAAYDIADAHFLLGRVLKKRGAAEAALQSLSEARQRFRHLAESGNQRAQYMASITLTESGRCLIDLEQFDAATTAYQEAIQYAKKVDDNRQIAVNIFQIGTVCLLQQRHAEALEIYTQAIKIFDALGELGNVATVWHQIGVLHRKRKQFEQAEQAYRQSLAIHVQQKNQQGECDSLIELGNLYEEMGRLEETVTFYQQAATIHAELQDLINEGRTRHTLANFLIKLHRDDEARRELQRALECKKPYGYATVPWTTWHLLYELEQATNHPEAAAVARQQAIQAFLEYRRAGGENPSGAGRLCAFIAKAMREGKMAEVKKALRERANWQIVPKLQAILRGNRNPALADDPNLHYELVVELKLLLESLPKKEGVVGKIKGWLRV